MVIDGNSACTFFGSVADEKLSHFQNQPVRMVTDDNVACQFFCEEKGSHFPELENSDGN